MNKGIRWCYYAVLSLSLIGLYAASFYGLTPSHFWNKVLTPCQKTASNVFSEKMGSKYSYRSGPYQLSPNLYVHSANELAETFESHAFSLESARLDHGTVPKLYLARLPSDFKKQPRKNRQMTFLQTVLPIIVAVNQGILEMRTQLEGLHTKQKTGIQLTSEEHLFLSKLYDDYNVKERTLEKLLQKVDIIPISLTLAQGILESGWGTSSLAQKANSLFGHTNSNNTMKRFPTLVNTVEYHVHNLNKHFAYKKFRQKRAELREKGHLDAHSLAEGLKPYSERGMAYVRDIRKIMKQYHLYEFDHHVSLDIKNQQIEKEA
ncbi:MAG: glucosaminidase domain-containing protein [Proteobacteria bacterium]|nr:glucosaminidase domain-containing protein [Pseudomonadota bacterium]